MIRKMIYFLIALLTFLAFSLTISDQKAAAASDTGQTTVILHHRLFWDNLPADQTVTSDDGSFPGKNTTFAVYDITSEYHHALKQHDSHFLASFKGMTETEISDYVKANDLTELAQTVTDENGIANFDLASNDQQAYLIVSLGNNQKQVNDLVFEQRPDPIAINFPIYVGETNQLLNPVNIYTKSAVISRVPYFFKYGETLSKETKALAGVQFVFYKIDAGQKYYLTSANNWIQTTSPLSNELVEKFVSDKNGLVTLNNSQLLAGSYYFQEVKTVAGYTISAAAEKIEVDIPAISDISNLQAIKVNGQALLKLTDGQIPDSAYKTAVPKVYNYQAGPKKTENQLFPFLPQTGETIGTISLIGLLIILVIGLIFIKKRKGV